MTDSKKWSEKLCYSKNIIVFKFFYIVKKLFDFHTVKLGKMEMARTGFKRTY